MTWDEYTDRYREGRTGFDPFVADAPGQETWAEMVARTGKAMAMLADRHPGGTVVVACHGGVAAASMISRLGSPLHKPVWELEVDNASITEWEATAGRWRLVRFNDHAHIAGI
jgi:probable phosphoglycerate mutase